MAAAAARGRRHKRRLSPHEAHDRLEMKRVGKEVERAHRVGDVAFAREGLEVAAEGRGVARHVDDGRRRAARDRLDKLRAGAGAGRVEHHTLARSDAPRLEAVESIAVVEADVTETGPPRVV